MSGNRWRRGDGMVLCPEDLLDAIPMMPYELDDITFLLDLVEDWLRRGADARLDLADFLTAQGRQATVADVITDLGALSTRLHQLVRAIDLTGAAGQPI
jgi:hypothetical protein